MSKEGVAQDDPLAIVLYGIVLFPLIDHLRTAYNGMLQPWYVDDGAMYIHVSRIAPYFEEMC